MKLIFNKMLKIIHIGEKMLRYDVNNLNKELYNPGDLYKLNLIGLCNDNDYYHLLISFTFIDYNIIFYLDTFDFKHNPINSFRVSIKSNQINSIYTYTSKKSFEHSRLYLGLISTFKDKINDKNEYNKLILTLDSNILELL